MSKTKKRNLSLLAVLMFVAAAVLLNWSYNQRWGKPDAEMVSAEDAGIREAAARADKMAASTSEYFSEARLTRQTSRDEALQLLQTAASADTASQETIDSAMNAISAMAKEIGARVTVPMHYRGRGFGYPVIGRVEDFTKRMQNVRVVDTNTFDLAQTPDGVVVLRCPVLS